MAGTDCTRTHTCAHCGTKFAGRKKKFCSPGCRRGSKTIPVSGKCSCAHCGTEIKGRWKRFCSADCRIAHGAGHDPAGHKCAECGVRFTGRKMKYCSAACHDKAKQDRDCISHYLRRENPVATKERLARLREEFVAQYGSWRGHMATRLGSEYYRSPLYKRIAAFRKCRRDGRRYSYRPLNDGERAIWQAHKARRAAWGRYLAICAQIDSGEWGQVRRLNSSSPYDLMTEDQVRQSNARHWRWRYANEPKFKARVKAAAKAKKYRRRLQKAATDDGTVTPDLYGQRRSCLYCGVSLNGQNRSVDHMVPLSLGGMHSAANITECCRSCNSQKRAMPFDQWLDQLDEPHRSRAEREYIKKQNAHPKQLTLTAVAPAP